MGVWGVRGLLACVCLFVCAVTCLFAAFACDIVMPLVVVVIAVILLIICMLTLLFCRFVVHILISSFGFICCVCFDCVLLMICYLLFAAFGVSPTWRTFAVFECC